MPSIEDGRVTRIVEKPVDPPSHFAVTGHLLLRGGRVRRDPELEPSGRGELEITDVNNHYVGGVDGVRRLRGFWGDAGESIDAYYEVNDFVRANGANKP